MLYLQNFIFKSKRYPHKSESQKKDRKKLFFIKRWLYYLTIRGGSLKNIAKNIIPSVPISKKVYTRASIKVFF